MPTPYFLRIDFLPHRALPTTGRLGLTRAPGRYAEGRSFDSDLRLREDLGAIAKDHGASLLVTLLEQHEIAELGRLDLAARRAGLRWRHFPIPDMHVPASYSSTGKLAAELLGALEKGETVVLHCWGGLGRTGTIAACVLVANGTEPEQAIRHVRAARPGSVEVPSQEAFVHELAAWRNER